MRFLTWFSFKKFKYNITKWAFPIIIAFLGLLLINTTLAVALVGQNIIKVNFLENNNIKFLKVTPERITDKISFHYINRNKNPKVVLFPYMNILNVNVPIRKIDSGEYLKDAGIPLPYEALEILGIENINQEEWDAGKVIIISEQYAQEYNLSVNDEVVLDWAKTDGSIGLAQSMDEKQFQNYLDNLIIQFNENPIKIVQINELSLVEFSDGVGIIPLNLYYDFHAKMENVDKETFIASNESEEGMAVLVKDFSDVESEAQNLMSRNFTVEYSLAAFENLSKIIEYVYYGLIVLVLFISVIVIISIVNCIMQLLLFQKREIGILLSMGIPKIKIISSYLYELFFSNIIVIMLQIPCIILVIYQSQNILFELLPDNFESSFSWSLFFLMILCNIILLFLISLSGAAIPMVKMFKNKINNLIISE